MAIKWKTKISVLDVKRGNVRVTLEKVDEDSTDPQDIKTTILNSCVILDGIINTPELKQQVLTELERQYREQEKKKKDDAAIIGTFDTEIADATATWSIT